jgi:hypothetical protein
MPGPLVDPRSLRDAIGPEESRLLHLKTELGHAQARLAELKTTLAAHGEPVETSPSAPSTASEKVALFRFRFRGRDDIDRDVPMLARMFEKRLRGARSLRHSRGPR